MFTPLNRGNLTLVECPLCGRTRSLSPVKSVLRFPSHEPRTIQAEVKDKRWSPTCKTGWDVVGGERMNGKHSRPMKLFHLFFRENASTTVVENAGNESRTGKTRPVIVPASSALWRVERSLDLLEGT
jgi:hypothetical protein